MLRAVVREQVQVQVQFWLVLGFCFCSPQAARGRGVAHGGVLGGVVQVLVWPSKTVWFAAKCAGPAAIGPVGGGGLHRSRLRFRCRAAVEKGSKGVVCCHAPVLQLGPMLALVVEPKTYVVRGWDGTGAGSGSKHPAVTVLGGVRFVVLKPSCGNMHTWSLCLRWLWGRAVQEQVQVQDVWLAV